MVDLIWLIYNCIRYGAYSVDTCIAKKMYVYICYGFPDTNWSWYLYFDVHTVNPLHPLILYFLRISLSHGILESQRLRNSILPINSTDDINPNRTYIEAQVLGIFCLIKRWLSVDISTLNKSLCLSNFKPSILVSFPFVLRRSFAKFNSFWEVRSFVFSAICEV